MGTHPRRQVLAGLGIGAATAVAAPSLLLAACSDSTSHANVAPGDPLVPLGRAYLDLVPHEADAGVLTGLVDGLGEVRDGDAARALLARLRPTVEREFASDRTVAVRGWVLARSEARVAAYLALG